MLENKRILSELKQEEPIENKLGIMKCKVSLDKKIEQPKKVAHKGGLVFLTETNKKPVGLLQKSLILFQYVSGITILILGLSIALNYSIETSVVALCLLIYSFSKA